jgi:hypothetical protein
MSNEVANLKDLTDRLERLERQNRWLKGGVVAAILGAGLVVYLIHGGSAEARRADEKLPVLKGSGLSIVDRNGKVRIAAGMDKADKVSLVMYDGEGTARLDASVAKNGVPQVRFWDPAVPFVRLTLGVDDSAQPYVNLIDTGGGKVKASMYVDTKGAPHLKLLDSKGKPRAWMAVSPNDPENAGFSLYDAKGKVIWTAK